jgi:hypothetical protein
MKAIAYPLFAALLFAYGLLFSHLDTKAQGRFTPLQFAPPPAFYQVAAGYLRQLAAEMLFIRTSVFLGGVPPGTDKTSYEDALANNFEVMTGLYPRFIAPYYFTQGFLPSISQESAARAAGIFEAGIAAYPEDIVLRFFYGANFFLTMNEPLKGAKAFAEAAQIPKAPPMFGHLAALLSAQGGDIAAGLISLKTMLAAEKEEVVRKRYEEEIVIFEQALKVQKGLNAYSGKYGAAPERLEQLAPEFLPQLPETGDSFDLVYDPPNLHLKRPDRKKKSETGIPWK